MIRGCCFQDKYRRMTCWIKKQSNNQNARLSRSTALAHDGGADFHDHLRGLQSPFQPLGFPLRCRRTQRTVVDVKRWPLKLNSKVCSMTVVFFLWFNYRNDAEVTIRKDVYKHSSRKC